MKTLWEAFDVLDKTKELSAFSSDIYSTRRDLMNLLEKNFEIIYYNKRKHADKMNEETLFLEGKNFELWIEEALVIEELEELIEGMNLK